MSFDPFDIQNLRLGCARIYSAWWNGNLQPGRGTTEHPGPEQDEMVSQVMEEWRDLTGCSLGEFPWTLGTVVREWIAFRKKTQKQKECQVKSQQLSLLPECEGQIYFLEETDTGNIKIGFTNKPLGKRLQGIKGNNSSPLSFLGSMAGTQQHERTLHITFAGDRLHRDREWFRPCKTLSEFIKTHASL